MIVDLEYVLIIGIEVLIIITCIDVVASPTADPRVASSTRAVPILS